MIKEKLKLVPTNPGCYLMKDENNIIIYVGKAKNLKNRLSSYFTGSHNGKTLILINNIFDFEYIITKSEVESLILELNLIKKYNPKYNILLKDDKSYPYIEITNEKIPRLSIKRNVRNKKSKLFGPYPNVTAARETVNLLNRLYPLRKCKTYPKKPCLYYDINQCLGYCINNIEQNKINNMMLEISRILNGDNKLLTSKIKNEININSNNLQYEKCLELKTMLDHIEKTLNNQKININDLIDRDVFGYYSNNGYISIQVFFLRRGSLVERKSDIFPMIENESEELIRYITLFYDKNLLPKEIITPFIVDNDLLTKTLSNSVFTPQKGIKKKLLEMANANAKLSLNNEFELIIKNEDKINNAINELKELLSLKKLDKIETFDNSHLFGDFSVSGLVVFENGKPNKNEYRKYKIISNVKDDYHMMQEVIYRRYFKMIKEKKVLPDLILVDGGKPQVNAATSILKQLNLNILVVGLTKDNKHNTNKLTLDKEIIIDKTSDLFFLLTKIQNEVHRYTINYHKNIRSKGSLGSILDEIPGIGKTRKLQLIKKFGSLEKMKSATKEDLKEILPDKVIDNFINTFNI